MVIKKQGARTHEDVGSTTSESQTEVWRSAKPMSACAIEQKRKSVPPLSPVKSPPLWRVFRVLENLITLDLMWKFGYSELVKEVVMGKLRIAIIGCKNMGQKHLKTLREDFADTVEVVGILNSTPETSAQRAAELNVAYFTDIDEVTKDNVDAAIVSTPGLTHAKIGEKLLLRGIPCLVEKPMATTLNGCDKLISAAKKGKSLIAVGHVENYNPAIIRLKDELKAPVLRISGIRTSRNSANKTGISAVQELMIHDLAIVYSLLGNDLESSQVSKRQDLSWENHAVVEMVYKSGATVKLEALREDREVERFMDVTDAEGNKFHIDFMTCQLLKNGQVLTSGGKSLKNELADFIGCVKSKTSPMVGMYEAKDIVELCLDLEKGMAGKDTLLNNEFLGKGSR